jgi:hypothetical protein
VKIQQSAYPDGIYPPDRDIIISAIIQDPQNSLKTIEWKHVEIQPLLRDTIFKSATSGLNAIALDIGTLVNHTDRMPFTIVILVSNGAATVSDTVSIRINSPPTPGMFKFTPSEGHALTTNFTVDVSNWMDDSLNINSAGMLSYWLEYLLPGEVDPVLLTNPVQYGYGEHAITNVKFPSILGSGDTFVTVMLKVRDSSGTVSTAQTVVKIYAGVPLYGVKAANTYLAQIQMTPSTFATNNVRSRATPL